MSIRRINWLLIVALLTTACDARRPLSKAKAESWVAQDPKTWPQIVLTNDATFAKKHSSLEGASCFLVKASDGRVFGVTAKHLIGEDGGVEPEIKPAYLNSVIKSWKMSPRTMPESFVEVNKLAAYGATETDDWLLFSMKEKSPLPAEALKVRKDSVEVGETVYLLGCPYEDEKTKQNVYKGLVRAGFKNQFTFEFVPAVDLRGFSGAPIVDANGHLVGILTGMAQLRNAQMNSSAAGRAECTDAIYEWLESAK